MINNLKNLLKVQDSKRNKKILYAYTHKYISN